MKRRLFIAPVMLIALGMLVFTLPMWVSGANAELAERTGTVGGALVGIGVVAALVLLVVGRK